MADIVDISEGKPTEATVAYSPLIFHRDDPSGETIVFVDGRIAGGAYRDRGVWFSSMLEDEYECHVCLADLLLSIKKTVERKDWKFPT